MLITRLAGTLLLFLSPLLSAQFYEYGQDAGHLRWWQLSTPHYQVIYPQGVDSVARAYAGRLESVYPHLGTALDHEHRRMPVVIHNESSFSNGVFVWAPRRLEIFSNPDPNAYNQDWLTQLAVHEGRHAVQIDKLDQGFTHGLYFLGGEQLVGAMAIFLPYWYLEGDAVDAETRLTLTGRGRQPSFEMMLKAQLLEKQRMYSFSKASLGSYKHFIPDHYRLGYSLVRYGRRTYGDQLWIDFQQYAARKPFLLNPTWFAMRSYGIKSKKQFYRDALDSFKSHWSKTDSLRILTPGVERSPSHRHYTSYRFPHQGPQASLYSYRSGMDQIPEFVRVDSNGKAERLFRPGYMNSGRVSFSKGSAVWDEWVPDLRWSNRNFSRIRKLDLVTGKVQNLGRETRYYAPALSGNGQLIAAIEQNTFQHFSLVILDADGKLQKKLPAPDNAFIQHPAWSDEGKKVVVIQADQREEILSECDLETGSWEVLYRAGMEDLSHPVSRDGRIYFSGTFTGIDNIFCFERSSGICYQLTSSRFGAFEPELSDDGRELYYSDYHAGGYRMVQLSLDSALWLPVEEVRMHTEQLDYAFAPAKARIPEDYETLPDSAVVLGRYRKLPHLFNVHSWLPLYVNYLDPELSLNPENLPVNAGLSLISQNRLSTAVSQLGYEYREGYHMFHSGIKLKGRYPVLNLFFDYGGEPRVLLYKEAADTAMALPQAMSFKAQSYVPLRLKTGKYLSLIQPGVEYTYQRDLQYIVENEEYKQGTSYLHYTFYATSYLRMGQRDILPRLGLSLSGGYYHALGNNRVVGALSHGKLTAWLPGLLKHQSIRLSISHQQQYAGESTHHSFVNLMSLPRGYISIFGEQLTKVSADYVFPLLYPDLALSGLLYLKRIRSALWVDYMLGNNVRIPRSSDLDPKAEYGSLGVDLLLDLNVLRIPFPLAVGGRFIYIPDEKQLSFEALFSIDIN